ncbi:MAG TPA: DUF2058 family protein [Steroidobacteraceae bacterium]|uniref:DUF2058 family protein n=1 Tax=Dokdonella sp. TaxID=2291710 RepID=UPI0025C45595|nr:DUF2058 family protein [Dokdonella sp.]MBX3692293.1 DUF2058 family protein [Dokdonella sp.]MCW5569215.1 DUF2058 family protein [Dokdonella sp.]HNR23648.1 DUF2058 family protein [Steroidobacteraceae bacterium]
MADSLRDQLLKTGLVQKLKAEARAAAPVEAKGKADARKPGVRRPDAMPRKHEEMDLAKAYALRERAEREQREQEKRAAEQRAKEKAERKRKLAALLDGQGLNDKDADVARHFPHGDKIKRVYCTPAQLAAINTGELAIVQHLGRYHIVPRALGEQVREVAPEALVLLCEPGAVDDDGVPADLTW